MLQVWRICLDRYEDESRAKSIDGRIYSVIETAKLIYDKYLQTRIKPQIIVEMVGIGAALYDYLRSKDIPVISSYSLCSRVGSADIYKTQLK